MPQNNMFAELLAQISGANPNWAYDDAQVSQLDDVFRRQFADQQGQQQSPYALPPERPLDMPTPAPQIPPPQMPTPGIPTATGGLDSERLGEVTDAIRRKQRDQPARIVPPRPWRDQPPTSRAEPYPEPKYAEPMPQGIPRIPVATPGYAPEVAIRPEQPMPPVQQMPRSQRMGKPMSPMFEGSQRPPGRGSYAQQRQPLRQQPQQQAPRSGSGTWVGHANAGSRNIGRSHMPNTGQEISQAEWSRKYGPQQAKQPSQFGRPSTFGPGQPGFAPTHGAAGRGAMGGGGSPHLMNQPRQRTGGPTNLNNFLARESLLSPGG